VTADYSDSRDATFLSTLKGLMTRTFSRKEVNTFKGMWRHPAKGTGQICDALQREATASGARFHFDANVHELQQSGGRITGAVVEAAGETVQYEVQHVISSIPTPFLLKLLMKERFDTLDPSLKAPPSSKKTIVLVYLFLNENSQFPHAWLNVTCPDTRIGRITNYSGMQGDMVPAGKTCLCCEFYCLSDDPLLGLDDNGFTDLASGECARNGLLHPTALTDSLVLRLPGADASQNRHNWMSNMRKGLLDILNPFENLYYAARTDLDIATLAGIESAEAVLSGDRSTFDRHIDPRNLDIRSAQKAFEFKNPAEQGV
jgi:hypothetical protein